MANAVKFLSATLLVALLSGQDSPARSAQPAPVPGAQQVTIPPPGGESLLPPPSGAYPVGTYSVTVGDPTRREFFTPDPDDFRRNSVQVYYPAASTCRPSRQFPASLAEVYAQELGMLPGLDKILLAHACPGAGVAGRGSRFPVVLFSHGLQHTRFSYTSILEDLASKGYVVIAIDHPHGGRATYFPDLPLVRWDNSRWGRGDDAVRYEHARREYFRIWADDVRGILDGIFAGTNEVLTRRLRRRTDMERVAYIGHSFGGLSAIYASFLDRRIDGAVNMDGSIGAGIDEKGAPRPLRLPIPVHSDVPMLILNSMENVEHHYFGRGVRVARINGSNHMTFSDYVWMAEKAGSPDARESFAAAPINGEQSIRLTRDILTEFLTCTFRSRCTDLDAQLSRLRAPLPS